MNYGLLNGMNDHASKASVKRGVQSQMFLEDPYSLPPALTSHSLRSHSASRPSILVSLCFYHVSHPNQVTGDSQGAQSPGFQKGSPDLKLQFLHLAPSPFPCFIFLPQHLPLSNITYILCLFIVCIPLLENKLHAGRRIYFIYCFIFSTSNSVQLIAGAQAI